VAGTPRRRSNKFETERFEAKINLRVHQAAGMNRQEFHLFRTGLIWLIFLWSKYFPNFFA
jgi:hypothetical protein